MTHGTRDTLRNRLRKHHEAILAEKPVEVKAFSTLRLYLYSEQMTREELAESLKRW